MDSSTTSSAVTDALTQSSMIRDKIQWPGEPSLEQNFSLPLPIISYIAMNPENVEVYKKLIQTCKYFFEVNPILVAARMHEPDDYEDDGKTRICPKEEHANRCEINECCIEIDLNKLSSKLWLTNRLSIHGNQTPNFSSLLRQKLYRCDISELFLCDVKMPLDDFKFLVQTVKILSLLWKLKILHADGKIVKLDEILGVCPAIEIFYGNPEGNKTIFAASTLKNIAKLRTQNLSNLKCFHMFHIPEIFAIQDISDFVLKSFSDAYTILLQFGPHASDEFVTQLGALDKKIRESNKNHKV